MAGISGIRSYWKNMKGLPENKDATPGLTFLKFWQVIRRILVHRDFKRCTENKRRSLAHLSVFWGFILLLFVTFFAILSTIFFEYPLGILNPIKIAGNLGAFLLIAGSSLMILHRLRNKNGLESGYEDWFFLLSFWLLTLSGMLVEGARFHEWGFAYHLYFVHLVLVGIIILYLPYTKFAHIVYRTFAMAFERYRDSAYVKNPLSDEK